MKSNKSFGSMTLIFVLIAALYVFAFLIIPFEKSATSWFAFAFTLVAFAFCYGTFCLAFAKNDSLVSKVYGLPIVRVGVIYLVVQLVLGFLFCVIGAFTTLKTWIVLLFSVVPLALALIGLIAFEGVRDFIEKQEAEDIRKTRSSRLFRINIDSIVDLCDNAEVKAPLKKLAEDIRYSDPVSGDETAAIEEQILNEINNLRSMINTPAALGQIQFVSNLLKDRNRICQMYKR